MLQGKENHMELIQELRTVHALQTEEQELKEADKELVLSLKEQRDNARHKVRHTRTQNSVLKCHHTFSPMDRLCKKRHLRLERWVQNFTICLTQCPRSWHVSRRSVGFMLWFYWLRETDACERLRRAEEDKWRSADEERKMRFSDKCVFDDLYECVCGWYGLMVRLCFFAGGSSPSRNCGFVLGGHHSGNLREYNWPAGQRGHPQKGTGGQQHGFYNGGKVTNVPAAKSS